MPVLCWETKKKSPDKIIRSLCQNPRPPISSSLSISSAAAAAASEAAATASFGRAARSASTALSTRGPSSPPPLPLLSTPLLQFGSVWVVGLSGVRLRGVCVRRRPAASWQQCTCLQVCDLKRMLHNTLELSITGQPHAVLMEQQAPPAPPAKWRNPRWSSMGSSNVCMSRYGDSHTP